MRNIFSIITAGFFYYKQKYVVDNKVRKLELRDGLFIMSLYQLDKQSTKFTIWKY